MPQLPRTATLLAAVCLFLPASLAQQTLPAEPAIPAILQAFTTHEVVAMPAAHAARDTDDLILTLIRDPRFPSAAQDIVVECGNQRFQPVLDRYIAGDDVPFPEVQHVWRDTTVLQMCGTSGFYEQLFPLVRALNQHLPAAQRLRVVAADPPVDWAAIHAYADLSPFFDRDGSIASVMEREVLARHRKALMLFGVFHILHGGGPAQGDAVTRFERLYPNRTFVIADLGYYDTAKPLFAGLHAPALLPTAGSPLGRLPLDAFLPSPLTTDAECNVAEAFSGAATRPVVTEADAFLYLGPRDTLLAEPLPASIALDRTYRAEWLRRLHIIGFPAPATLEDLDAQTLAQAANPILPTTPGQDTATLRAKLRRNCLASSIKRTR